MGSPKMTDRKFDTWKWHDGRAWPEPLEFEVRVSRPENVAHGGIEYYIQRDDNPHIDVRAKDLPALRDKLDAAIREWARIAWEPVLVITINPQRTWHVNKEFGTDLAIDVHEYERGMRAGKPYYRRQVKDARGALVNSYGPEEWIKTGVLGERKIDYTEDGAQLAIIADTATNREALRSFRAGFVELITRLRELLGPSKAQETLARVSADRLLVIGPTADPEMPWCEPCRSYHVVPKDEHHQRLLKCRSTERPWETSAQAPAREHGGLDASDLEGSALS